MVLSKINNQVSYPERKTVDDDDLNRSTDLYQIEVKNVEIMIGVGNPKYTFKDKNIVYFPIYLVKSNDRVVQIGLYELEASQLEANKSTYMDSKNNVNVEKLSMSSEPLIYVFVDTAMLEKERRIPEESLEKEVEEEEEVEEEGKEEEDGKEKEREREKEKGEVIAEGVIAEGEIQQIPENRQDIFLEMEGISVPALLMEETKLLADQLQLAYERSKGDGSRNWIEKFMKNRNYTIQDNEGNGDCLFATIRDAFLQIGQQTTVPKIRNKLSEEATEAVFLGYREQYDDITHSILKDNLEIKELSIQHKKLQEQCNQTLEQAEKRKCIDAAKVIELKVKQLEREMKMSKELLKEYKFMKGVDTLGKFKDIIRTCAFWGETWAISTIERILNIKLILLSHEAYTEKDFANVLNCGQLNDSILEQQGKFEPEYYVLVEYTGNHYRLIGYKKKHILKFQEIPFDIKKLVVNKCLERNSGVFSLIPDFVKFKESEEGPQKIPVVSTFMASAKELYDEHIVFVFYDKSASKPLPGKGAGEKIEGGADMKQFSELASIQDWRKKLDDEWIQPFTLDNHQWSSVEHYYQASKFKKNNPAFYLSFSLDSNTERSKNVDMAIGAGSKSGKYKGTLLRPKEVVIDDEFYGKRREKEIMDAQYAKFTQHKELKELLMNTKKATLMHYIHRGEPELVKSLMEIRSRLLQQS